MIARAMEWPIGYMEFGIICSRDARDWNTRLPVASSLRRSFHGRECHARGDVSTEVMSGTCEALIKAHSLTKSRMGASLLHQHIVADTMVNRSA